MTLVKDLNKNAKLSSNVDSNERLRKLNQGYFSQKEFYRIPEIIILKIITFKFFLCVIFRYIIIVA